MGSSDRLFNRQRTIHQILGGDLVADVMLWRQKNLTVGILVVILAAWVVFERSGYTLLSLTSSVFFAPVYHSFSLGKISSYFKQDITFGRDLRMFVKVALSLLLICVIRSLSDFLTLIYTGLVILLTVTALYERYEDHIDRHALTGYRCSQHLYMKIDAQFISKVQKWILEKKKLS